MKTILKKYLSLIVEVYITFSLAACSSGETNATAGDEKSASAAGTSAKSSAEATTESRAEQATVEADFDYKVLVNKTNPLPDNWEDKLETVHFTNSVGDDVEIETKAYDAYLLLKEDLEKEGIYIDLDSAYRSVADQQRIMDEFTEEYGEDYAKEIVAQPGYSEHHTGLALDLILIVDGKPVVENEDLVKYTEIWDKIHAKIADYGFILRYLNDKEHITGYAYEPWHIRYLNDVDTAHEIMKEGITYEGYLGAAAETDVIIDYGTSELYSPG